MEVTRSGTPETAIECILSAQAGVETLAKIVEQHPSLVEDAGETLASAADVSRIEKEGRELHEVTHSFRVFSPDGRLVWKGPDAVTHMLRF